MKEPITMYATIRFSDASSDVLRAVLVACSQQRHNTPEYVQHQPEGWAPQVHVSGSKDGQTLFAIITPKFRVEGLDAIVTAAREAEQAADGSPA